MPQSMGCSLSNLTGRGPLGQKAPKPINGTAACREHMGRVAGMCCLVCGAWHVEVHHEGKPRNDMNVLPLCPPHHRREYGPGAYHYSPKAFYALHGSSAELLARVKTLLGEDGDQ
jgi:hypothetical protein